MSDEQNAKGMEFPCKITLKIFVEHGEINADDMHALVLRVVDYADIHDIQSRPSRKGNYLAYSVAVHARSKDLMDELFTLLSAHPKILMVI